LSQHAFRHEPDSTLCSGGWQMMRIGKDVADMLHYHLGFLCEAPRPRQVGLRAVGLAAEHVAAATAALERIALPPAFYIIVSDKMLSAA